ncbi:hypothetical protein [Stutzerimonas xanthomarina]|uniref:hypothetical protein n=1 Tax=Stutzerimonas xanthomarina TaxID=271420 RepID=UPI003AA7B732
MYESGGAIVSNFFPADAPCHLDSFDAGLTCTKTPSRDPARLPAVCAKTHSRGDHLHCLGRPHPERLSYEQAFLLNGRTTSSRTGASEEQRIDINKHQTVRGDDALSSLRPAFMVALERAQHALDTLRGVAWEMVEPVRLSRGDLPIIDSRRTAHAQPLHCPLRVMTAGCNAPSPPAPAFCRATGQASRFRW